MFKNPTNIYEDFINYLYILEKTLKTMSNLNIEKHHILPLHAGGTKNGPCVLCTSKNHTLAHYYRYLVFRQKGDFVAYTMRWNQKIGIKQRALLAVETNKQLKNIFWNSKWQSQQGKKGGKKGGCVNSFKQKKARSCIGKKYGYKTGKNNQSSKLKKIISKKTIWLYNSNKASFFISIKPQKSFSNIIKILQSKTPHIKRNPSSFYKVVYGERAQMYGWNLYFIKI